MLYAQSGGVTAVINATAAAVIAEARVHGVPVLAARSGILGVLNDDLIDTRACVRRISAPSHRHRAAPSAAAGSS